MSTLSLSLSVVAKESALTAVSMQISNTDVFVLHLQLEVLWVFVVELTFWSVFDWAPKGTQRLGGSNSCRGPNPHRVSPVSWDVEMPRQNRQNADICRWLGGETWVKHR